MRSVKVEVMGRVRDRARSPISKQVEDQAWVRVWHLVLSRGEDRLAGRVWKGVKDHA